MADHLALKAHLDAGKSVGDYRQSVGVDQFREEMAALMAFESKRHQALLAYGESVYVMAEKREALEEIDPTFAQRAQS